MRKHLCPCVFAFVVLAISGAAQAQFVVVGHPNAPALSNEQIADIYTGKTQIVMPLDQPESATIRADFYKKATGKEPAQVKALWSRLIFTGKAQPPKEVPDSAAVKKAVAADSKAVGYIDKAAADGSVKVLATFN